MKRYISALFILCLCFMLAGCGFWMDGSYHSVEPYRQEYVEPSAESAEVTDEEQLRDALVDMVGSGTQESVIYMRGFDHDTLDGIVKSAVEYVIQFDPVGAYAVQSVDYEIGTNIGRVAVKVNISYVHNRSEILRIYYVDDMEQASGAMCRAIKDCKTGVVLYINDYNEIDFIQKAQDYVDANPAYCMEMPQVSASVYPKTGKSRVVELTFTYQTSRDTLRTMQVYVEPVFRAAYLNVSSEDSERTKFERMYSFLMERADYTVETSITPAYSLLRHGVGDSKAFATLYSAMCRQAGLECLVITGTRDGTPWVWNLICENGQYYHVDLLDSSSAGRMIRQTDSDMSGYVWDYSAFPAAQEPEETVSIPELTVTESSEPEATEEPTQAQTETVPETTEPEQTEVPSEPKLVEKVPENEK